MSKKRNIFFALSERDFYLAIPVLLQLTSTIIWNFQDAILCMPTKCLSLEIETFFWNVVSLAHHFPLMRYIWKACTNFSCFYCASLLAFVGPHFLDNALYFSFWGENVSLSLIGVTIIAINSASAWSESGHSSCCSN